MTDEHHRALWDDVVEDAPQVVAELVDCRVAVRRPAGTPVRALVVVDRANQAAVGRTLARGHRSVDGARRIGRSVARVVTDLFAFGDEVPAAYVDFVDSMLSQTPFEVVADFFPSFNGLDKFDAVEVLGRVPTTIICGTADKLTSISHSRKLHERVPGSTLLECENAGHMVILERHGQVNAALDQLLSAAAETVGLR